MYIKIVCNSRKIYEIWHVRSDHKLWNKEFFSGLAVYLSSKYPNDDFACHEAKDSICDKDLDEIGYKKWDKIFEQGKIEYDAIVLQRDSNT